MRIAVDIFGGDHAPDAILKGCVLALDEMPAGDQLVLVGKERDIREMLEDRDISPQDPRLEIINAEQVIEMGDSAAKAVRSKTDSSIVKMSMLGAEGHPNRCDVVLSARNTGACVAAAMLHMRRLPNVMRPGICVTIPALANNVVLIDAGANPEPKGEHLWQYGVMADCLARCVHKSRILASPL